MTLKLQLVRKTLANSDDGGGRWQSEGGSVFDGPNQVAWYAGTKRVTWGGTEAQNTAAVSCTLFFIGSSPPETITVQGAHTFDSGNQSGSVSAASELFRSYRGGSFSRTGDTILLEEGAPPVTPVLSDPRDATLVIGSAPAWLVSRYTVQCTYRTVSGAVRPCAEGVFAADGGVVKGRIEADGRLFPDVADVTVTMDFQPDTGLPGLVKSFTAPVTGTGVNFIFEPYQILQRTALLLDLQPAPLASDYLSLRWTHATASGVVASGQKYLSGDDLGAQPVTQYEIVFVPDPIEAREVTLRIEGRYQGQDLPRFEKSFALSDNAVLLRAAQSRPGDRYTLVVV